MSEWNNIYRRYSCSCAVPINIKALRVTAALFNSFASCRWALVRCCWASNKVVVWFSNSTPALTHLHSDLCVVLFSARSFFSHNYIVFFFVHSSAVVILNKKRKFCNDLVFFIIFLCFSLFSSLHSSLFCVLFDFIKKNSSV